MLDPSHINPINNNHLVEFEDEDKVGSIYLGSSRPISSTRVGVCLRSELHAGERVLCAHGGLPVPGKRNLYLVQGKLFVRIGGKLQPPYIQIIPEEVALASLIDLPEDFFSGWYKVMDAHEAAEVQIGTIVLPLYGQPRLENMDDSEYVATSAIGVVQCLETEAS